LAFPLVSLPQTASRTPAPTMPHKVAIIVIDPAHGGVDTGARSSASVESEAVVDFGRAMRVALEAKGFVVKLTREGNQSPSFDERAAAANAQPDSIFVTLHVASTGTPSTARAYFNATSLAAPAQIVKSAAAGSPGERQLTGLLPWDRAQEPYLELSQRLAELVQIQLAQKFQGSPEIPAPAAIRQLRNIAAPAIAIEVSSIALEPAKLGRMGQQLGESLATAAGSFQQLLDQANGDKGPAQ
jgi:N-acetylmuramoyl-L-alanine amidase